MRRFRETVRSLMRERMLDAAYELTRARGWEKVRMSDIAAAVGVSRQTVYNEFGSKPALGQALVMRETERFLLGVREQLDAHPDDLGEAVAAAVTYTLRRAADNALLKAVLTSARGGPEDLLPLLTTRSEPVLHAARAMLTATVRDRWPSLETADVDLAIDSVVRLTVSHIMLPLEPAEETGWRLARLVLRVLRLE
ncbi:TetR family transcriptional regulator [Carbonactinospora thermoautotrophica]|uniref:TetR family transcriptional regulator n=2 Tax=Carbonactinospora thermoautotrophica TaxID=1469144 RepID=A0A132NGU2_9ACTN|nr:TetR family transcriptional regulator [Carbonactinospora thermoautotrophica]KWX05451.1 TetR family transcriptional regulator [Carbonactinospora thermoautotrophica]KWX09289.1 TetR family transcriptional regulator [Carbonactinospora thermoautotrophica]